MVREGFSLLKQLTIHATEGLLEEHPVLQFECSALVRVREPNHFRASR